jgi:cytidine deaminase
MLPDAFSPAVLGNQHGLFDAPRQPLHHDLADLDDLQAAAEEMAGRSYAPYSGNRAAVAVQTSAGKIIAAPYIENVAFNPSLSPLQGALVAMRMQRLAWADISRALLVETAGSLSSHEPATRELLAALGADSLEVLRLSPQT